MKSGLRAVELLPHGGTPRWINIRELTGHEELALDAEVDAARSELHTLAGLVDAVWVREESDAFPHGLDLPLADRDRILAEIARAIFGATLETHSTCSHCAATVVWSIPLDGVLAAVAPSAAVAVEPDGTLRIQGVRLSPPSSRDILSARGDAQALAARCWRSPEPVDRDRLGYALEAGYPPLDLDLGTCCFECGESCGSRLEIGSVLLRGMVRERALLMREVHVLSRTHRWTLSEILDLPRSRRHEFVRFALDAAPPKEPAA